MSDVYDLVVIGGGSGGVRAARIAAGHGAKVAIVEADRFGGTCVIRGCVPKKLLVYASRFADEFRDAAGFGWTVPEARFDWATLIANKDRELARLEGLYAANLERAGVTLFRARAAVSAADEVTLDDGRRLKCRRILIATGGVPKREPAWETIRQVLTSDEMFDLREQPKRLVVVGGGYIAVEFACVLRGLGSEVTLVYRGDQILRGFERELRDGLHDAMQERGIRIHLSRSISAFTQRADEIDVQLDDGSRLTADRVLMAIGRAPNIRGLGLDTVGVALGETGNIKVDDRSMTSVSGIFAIGDVTDRLNLTPVAIREGHAFADREFASKDVHADYEAVATAVFSTPELGTVGLTEDQACRTYNNVDIYRSRFRPLKATLGGDPIRTMMKLLVDADTQRVVGAHMLGPDAGEMVQLLAIALKMGATKADLDRTVAVHPTLAEEWVTMNGPPQRVSR